MKSLYLQFSEPSKTMRVGANYVLRFVVGTQKPVDDDYEKLHAADDLYLRVDGIDSSWSEGELTLPLPLGDAELRIEIKPPPDFEEERVQLRAHVTLGELGGTLVDLYEKDVLITGRRPPAAAGSFETRTSSTEYREERETLLRITESPIPNFGALYAMGNESELVFLAQRSGGETQISAKPLRLRNIKRLSLDLFIRDKGEVRFNDLSGLGKNLYHQLDPKILDWLSNLLRPRPGAEAGAPDAGQFPSLLIYEDTNDEIPWELIYFEPPVEGGPRGFLGTLAAVSRWGPLRKHGKDMMPAMSETERNGRLVSYVPLVPQFLHNVNQEIEAVKTCGGSSVESGPKLLEALSEQRDDVALVHIASHGTFQYDRPEGQALSFPTDEISALNLSNRNMDLLAHSKPVVFINACHSARGGQVGWSVCGLQVPFIRQGAEGLIGVMGRVRSKSAASIAARLFREMLKERPKAVAEILRQLRDEAVEKLQNRSAEEQKYFLDTFMYVFYGSPLKAVRIVGPGASGAEE